MDWKNWPILGKSRRAESPSERSYDMLATNTQLKELLERRISPVLEAEGYRYDGAYQWIGPWEGHARRVVHVRLLKGAGGEFAFGWCFDFVPVLQNDGRGYRYQRTEKSAGLQLFVWTRDLISPKGAEGRSYQFSLFGRDLEDVERLLLQVFERSKPLGDAWFSASQGAERCLAMAGEQSRQTLNHWPAPEYIRAFLLSASGREEEGLRALNDWFAQDPQIADALREKLRGKLKECGNLQGWAVPAENTPNP